MSLINFSLYSWSGWWTSLLLAPRLKSVLGSGSLIGSPVYVSPRLSFLFCTPLGYENQSSRSLGSANSLMVSPSFRVLLCSLSSYFYPVFSLWVVLIFLEYLKYNLFSIKVNQSTYSKTEVKEAKLLTQKHRVNSRVGLEPKQRYWHTYFKTKVELTQM